MWLSSCCSKNYFCRRGQVFGGPIRSAATDVVVKSSLNSNCAHTGVVATLDVDLLVPNKKRTRQIDLMFALGLQNHTGRWLAVTGILTRNVGAKIGRIDQAVSQLARNFGFNGSIFVNREKAATDAALIRNHNQLESL